MLATCPHFGCILAVFASELTLQQKRSALLCTFFVLHTPGKHAALNRADTAPCLPLRIVGSRKTVQSGRKFRRQLQRAVSMNKRRLVDRGGGAGRLDLDLTYVCDRLIAMAIPCVEGAVYRNDIRDVSARKGSCLHF